MKIQYQIVAAFVLAVMAGCDNTPSFKVEGNISGAEDKMLYMEYSSINGIIPLDSVELGSNGNFHFSCARPEAPDFYRLRIDNKVINFVADSTETISVNASFDKFSTGYEISGSESNIKIKEISILQSDLQNKINKIGKSGMPVGLAQDSIRSMVNTYKNSIKMNYIFASPDKASSYFALFQQINGLMLFDPLNSKDDVRCFAAVATSLNNRYPHSDRSKNLYNMVIKGMKNTRAPQPQQALEIPSDMIQETSIIDIPLKDIKGETKHLTDYKGKVVLIDFTAYATPESGARTLALRELYKKYSSKGLVIYQISLDTDEHFWKTACDNLPWVCVRDPQGPYSTYVNLYGVTALPTAFLVNKNNELVLRLNEKSDIEAEIQKLL